MSKLVFSPSDDEMLVKEVQKYPMLYNMEHADYNNYLLKDVIWKEISTKINKSVDDTKNRWKNIRDSYTRNKSKPGTGSAASTKTKLSLTLRVSLLDNFEYERDSTSNDPMDGNIDFLTDEEIDDTLYEAANNLPPAEMPSKKRGLSGTRKDADLIMNKSEEPNKRIKQTLEKEEDDMDDVDLFFKCIAAIVKTFSPKDQLLMKIKMLFIMAELEQKRDINKQPKQP
ncbi:uncharacterized protein LOC114128392 [Aphis gossypii]|uniref:uncharacterized protein LOC114128392 n=1 Tax=Aphis gossypii TaxID=80765 RepID=UPI002158F7BA|nr:uncharacterized protein LOC114128392 [Aphis gossypii]